jgi:hypothetical protein
VIFFAVALWNEPIDMERNIAIHVLGVAMLGTTVVYSLQWWRIRCISRSEEELALCEMCVA